MSAITRRIAGPAAAIVSAAAAIAVVFACGADVLGNALGRLLGALILSMFQF